MAEQHDNRTEQASARRKEDARRRGQVAVSRDVPSAAMLFGAVALLYLLSETAIVRLVNVMREWFIRGTEPTDICLPGLNSRKRSPTR